ncbi:hypothetical protein OF376_02050 [Ureaplasma miroungigenitalium]|uniref:Uncharacterized protein n=1 Tax=Ureaplasma miroungigenitalium TaxID=1042321 RepID=A0ABT3BMU3_9BACT|nr:hypothetical protein [Ureaplasma miroungigenitalium]MCV3728546.1 hypothetical protein [Ureaplasma miroungigenitalium]MCV3734447.1 hypothetical protein [Ureaplasma miroungigenitalium]
MLFNTMYHRIISNACCIANIFAFANNIIMYRFTKTMHGAWRMNQAKR